MAGPGAISPVVPSPSLSDRQGNRQLIQDPSGLYRLSIEMMSLESELQMNGGALAGGRVSRQKLLWHCCRPHPRDDGGLAEGEQRGSTEMEGKGG